MNGLLDPAEAEDEKQRREATFTRARRHCQDAIRLGDRKLARQKLAEMHHAAKLNRDGFFRALEMRVVVKAAAEIGDPALVRHYMAGLSKADRDEVLDYTLLSELGMKDEALAAALRSIKQETKELVEMDNPNIHFPVMSICDALKFLIAEGQKDVVHKALTSVVKTSSKWTTLGPNFTTSSVLSMFAEVVAQLEGPEQARMLLDQARNMPAKDVAPTFSKAPGSVRLRPKRRSAKWRVLSRKPGSSGRPPCAASPSPRSSPKPAAGKRSPPSAPKPPPPKKPPTSPSASAA